MDVDVWLKTAIEDATGRGLPALRPLLEALANAMRQLRRADFIDDATGGDGSSTTHGLRHEHD